MHNCAYLCIVLSDREVARRVKGLLSEYLALPVVVADKTRPRGSGTSYRPDLRITAGLHHFAVESKASGTTEQVASATRQLQAFIEHVPGVVPLVVVPFMSSGGKAYTQEQRMSWLDLSGNANIVADGIRIFVEGKANQFVRLGRPRDLFAARSVRITRALLLDPFRPQTQVELSRSTGLNRGTVSRVVAALLETDLVERLPLSPNEDANAIRVTDPRLLLDAWRDAADFEALNVHRFSVAARSGEDLARRAADMLTDAQVAPAATGLVAAWCYTPYADFRTVSFYVRELPPEDLLAKELGARPESRGANLWLVLPKDDGVHMGMNTLKGIPCVSAVQAYVDLKGHPERASDAADALKNDYLNWPVKLPAHASPYA